MLRVLIRFLQRLPLPIRYKIGVAFSLVLLLFVVNGFISTLLLLNIKQTEERQHSTDTYLEQLQLYDITYNSQLELYSDAVFLIRSPYFRNNFGDAFIVNQLENDRDTANAASDEFRKKMARLYVVVLPHFADLEKLIRSSDFDGGKQKWREFSPDFDKISQAIIERRTQLKAEQARGKTELADTINLSLTFIAGLSAFSLLLGLFFLFLIGHVLVNPLNNLKVGLAAIAQGDLNQHIEIYNRDEIGLLGNNFKQAVQSLQQVLRGVQIGENLSVVSEQLLSASRQQTEGAAEQVTSLGEVTDTIQDLNQTADLIAGRASNVAALITTTLEQIEQVAQAGLASRQCAGQMGLLVENTISGVAQVWEQTKEFSRIMTELNEQAEAINKVVRLLGSIADEVHLLSLNASIEAAGASQHGERFKVVAREIKQLAKRATESNQEVGKLIGAVQLSSRYALSQVEKDQARVLELVESNDTMQRSLTDMADSTRLVSQSVSQLQALAGQVSLQAHEIEQATYKQSLSSAQVIISARAAGMVAEETALTSLQISQSSSQLENLTSQLNRVLSQVRLTA